MTKAVSGKKITQLEAPKSPILGALICGTSRIGRFKGQNRLKRRHVGIYVYIVGIRGWVDSLEGIF